MDATVPHTPRTMFALRRDTLNSIESPPRPLPSWRVHRVDCPPTPGISRSARRGVIRSSGRLSYSPTPRLPLTGSAANSR
jgi:hypothetical protein